MKSDYPLNFAKSPTAMYGILDTPVHDGELPSYSMKKINLYSIQGFVSLKFSNEKLPAIGARVNVNMNSFGIGTVVAYFTEAGYLGVEVHLDSRPEWHKKQCKEKTNVLVFGIEIQVL